jgi:hypothetical protein
MRRKKDLDCNVSADAGSDPLDSLSDVLEYGFLAAVVARSDDQAEEFLFGP